MTKLLIVESPAKARTISGYLGPGWMVRASYGHIRDLPTRELGVQPEAGFACTYVSLDSKAKVISALKEAATKAEEIYLATDFDREGEAIAWHVAELLGIPSHKRQRITFTEITKTAINAAIAAPRALDQHLIDAQQARRVIDRLVGYTLSPLVSDWLRGRLSAGRVQSAGLKVIVDREREILAFEPITYYAIKALVTPHTTPGASTGEFWAGLVGVDGVDTKPQSIVDKQLADRIVADLKRGQAEISRVEAEEATRNPAPPFTTSSLQQEASRKLGFSPKKTMDIAQVLYQGVEVGGSAVGLITYMRTDSVNLAEEAVQAFREYIAETYPAEYHLSEPRTYSTRAKGAQEAHEAIRPTDIRRTPDSLDAYLDKDQLALYALIWQRSLATQMAPARYDTMKIGVKVDASANGSEPAHTYELEARGRRLIFDGFLALYEEGSDDEDTSAEEADTEELLPAVTVGQRAIVKDTTAKKSKTKPPARYTEASFIKELERLGIGRPSTFAATVTTLKDRGYVVVEKRKLKPTELGFVLVEVLENHFPDIVDAGFTSSMEETLDEIAAGNKKWVAEMDSFWRPFSERVAERRDSVNPDEVLGRVDRPCPRCGGELAQRFGKKGRFTACKNYPECRYALDGAAERTSEVCPACEKGHLNRRQKSGREYLSCEMYPECEYIRSADAEITDRICPQCEKGRVLERESKNGGVFYVCEFRPQCQWLEDPSVITTDETCPSCGEGKLIQRPSEYGDYLSCEHRKAGCKYLRGVADRILEEACPQCGARLVERQGKHGPYVCCEMRPVCGYIKRDEGEATGETCPACQEGHLVKKDGKYGAYLSCTRRQDGCKYLRGAEDKVLDEKCPQCGARLVERQGKHGPYVCCEMRPVCDYIKREGGGSAAVPTGVACPKCGKGELMGRNGSKGAFWGCSTYPKCKFTTEHRPMPAKCSSCGGLVVQTATQAECLDCHKPA